MFDSEMESLSREIDEDDESVAFSRVAAVGLLVILVSAAVSGVVLPQSAISSPVEYAGLLIAMSGVLIAAIALVGFG
jgi:uncharacterized membrane protein